MCPNGAANPTGAVTVILDEASDPQKQTWRTSAPQVGEGSPNRNGFETFLRKICISTIALCH